VKDALQALAVQRRDARVTFALGLLAQVRREDVRPTAVREPVDRAIADQKLARAQLSNRSVDVAGRSARRQLAVVVAREGFVRRQGLRLEETPRGWTERSDARAQHGLCALG
jgi:hypothetical protein